MGKLCNIQWLLWCARTWGWMPPNGTTLFAIPENRYSGQMAVWRGVVTRNDIRVRVGLDSIEAVAAMTTEHGVRCCIPHRHGQSNMMAGRTLVAVN